MTATTPTNKDREVVSNVLSMGYTQNGIDGETNRPLAFTKKYMVKKAGKNLQPNVVSVCIDLRTLDKKKIVVWVFDEKEGQYTFKYDVFDAEEMNEFRIATKQLGYKIEYGE